MKKKVVLTIVALLIVILLWNYNLLMYGFGQAVGQLRIIWNTVPVGEFLANSSHPDSIKYKLELVQEIKLYAFENLGINNSENYTTIYDQKGEHVLWVVTASEKYKLDEKIWSFPFLGTFPYKGFFNLEKAKSEFNKLVQQDYDSYIRPVEAWSTLGWFKDPILSNTLNREIGDLANLIIHELTHSTIYVKDSVEFNENLATFIGDKGAESFLSYKYGIESSEIIKYEASKSDRKKFSDHFLQSANLLDSLYSSIEGLGVEDKEKLKIKAILEITEALDTISFNDRSIFKNVFQGQQPNNAFFMSFKRYRSKQEEFEIELEKKFDNDLNFFLTYYKQRYPSL